MTATTDKAVPFARHGEAALAFLNSGTKASRKAGSFCGQCVVDETPLSEAQAKWLRQLLERAGLPPLADGGEA